MNILKVLCSHNWMAIIYFNFKMLPINQAIKLPFDFYHGIRFESLSGNIVLDMKKIQRGAIKIGGRGSEMFGHNSTIIDLQGTVIFNGNAELGHGSLLKIEKNATVRFGHHVRIGAFSKIFCTNSITFGDELDFSWECQIFDTNFHYIRDKLNNAIEPINAPIVIGSFNWFGNRVSVMKGTHTPNNFTVASNSLCNKNYTNLAAYSVIGGTPAKLLQCNKQRVFENLEDVSNL